jgi:hypothetical protein
MFFVRFGEKMSKVNIIIPITDEILTIKIFEVNIKYTGTIDNKINSKMKAFLYIKLEFKNN